MKNGQVRQLVPPSLLYEFPSRRRNTGSSVTVGDVFSCARDPEDAVVLTG